MKYEVVLPFHILGLKGLHIQILRLEGLHIHTEAELAHKLHHILLYIADHTLSHRLLHTGCCTVCQLLSCIHFHILYHRQCHIQSHICLHTDCQQEPSMLLQHQPKIKCCSFLLQMKIFSHIRALCGDSQGATEFDFLSIFDSIATWSYSIASIELNSTKLNWNWNLDNSKLKLAIIILKCIDFKCQISKTLHLRSIL